MSNTTSSEEKKRMYFYEEVLAPEFDSKMNMYDTLKRVEVIYNELLSPEKYDLNGKTLLDAGCGTGWFSKPAAERGAKVTSMDLGEKLLEEVKKKCESTRVVGSIMEMPFEDNSFDYVVSSEVIEHIPDANAAIKELYRVLKPGGTLVLTTPNKVWYFAIWFANTFKLRPYQGLENWLSQGELRRMLQGAGFQVETMHGIHLFPFISPLFYPVLNFFHRFKSGLGSLMLNTAVRCVK
jgi:ubiquinone biosynthesis O-methyltransferase